jgi:dipeptidyl-peptidase-3
MGLGGCKLAKCERPVYHISWRFPIADHLFKYHDIREEYGSKNILLANRMNANRSSVGSSKYLSSADAELYGKNLHTIRFVATVIHELLGHGTGKLLRESEPGKFNFNSSNPPLNPLTGTKVSSWYLPGETWTGKFEDFATTVEECRAILMSGYLIDDKELLEIFGFHDTSELTADDMIYISYVHLAVEGLRSLEHYSVTDHAWSQAHSQGYFAIFKHLLQDGDGVVSVDFDAKASHLVVRIDRSKIIASGKPALGDMMNRLHIWRCTADTTSLREYYGALTTVDGKYKEWREVVCSLPEARWKFVQANTFLVDGEVTVQEYDASDRGIIQSWAERDV